MLKMASFFAGVGGIDLGFSQTGAVETVYANEFDEYPARTFEANFDIKVDRRDIRDVQQGDVPDIDIIAGGFPCQSFSIAGRREGFNDSKGRGTLFFELMRIIGVKRPKAVFFENVKNLVTHDDGNTFRIIMHTLRKAGYYCKYKVMNASEYGNTPQNRERIYIVGFLDRGKCDAFGFPDAIRRTVMLRYPIDFLNKVDERYYYRSDKRSNDMYNKLVAACDDMDAVYQWRYCYVRKNKSGLIPTLTASMGIGGHNVPIVLTDYGIRKMTPRECFNAQGFPKDFKLPAMADSRLYKQAGNSVCVGVVRRIAENVAAIL